jgi:hypothetical protein
MSKEKILIANKEDSQKDIIKKDGVTYNDEIELFNNFATLYQIGTCKDFEWKDNELYGEIQFRDGIDIGKLNLDNMVFRVAGLSTESHREGDIEVIDKFEIESVSLVHKDNDVYNDRDD